MSPASGDFQVEMATVRECTVVSIQLMSPASGDLDEALEAAALDICFHSINVPSEWGLFRGQCYELQDRQQFPFN